ncbi:hypothetical protein OAQ99_01160 [Candidatus Kapabacteria bacterium]|nr:hypothetical protein [Candidatus Kapabacteria bacterium]
MGKKNVKEQEQELLKVAKHQSNELSEIKNVNQETKSSLVSSIDSSEKLLKELGAKVNKNDMENENTSTNTPVKVTKIRSWDEISSEAKEQILGEVSFTDLLSAEDIEKSVSKVAFLREEFDKEYNPQCDKYDYMIAAACGSIGGLIDAIFVDIPKEGMLSKKIDKKSDKVVEKIAEYFGWNKSKAVEKGSNTTKSAIGFLEKIFPVNYDHRHGGDVKHLFKMSTKNHHLKSIAHSPDIFGLVYSIFNQFTNTASFIDNGKIITIKTDTFELQGSNVASKIFSGFVNWIGHLASDFNGSSGNVNRGTGIPIPFYELFQFLNFGNFGKHKQSFADIATQVFEQGYDLRHGIAMSIPTIITELLVRFMFTIKQKFYHNKTWKESLPIGNNLELQRMLLTAHGCFFLIDVADAALKSGGNWVMFFTRMNLVESVRFAQLGFKEAKRLALRESKRHEQVMDNLNEDWTKLNKSLEETWALMSEEYVFVE